MKQRTLLIIAAMGIATLCICLGAVMLADDSATLWAPGVDWGYETSTKTL